MKNFLFPLFFAFLAGGLFAETTVLFSLKNETGEPISRLYASQSATDLWGDELLQGKTAFPPGATLRLSFSVHPADSRFDLKALSESGKLFTAYEVPVAEGASFALQKSHYESTVGDHASLTEAEAQSFAVKSSLNKNYINGYKQGFLNGYASGFRDGVASLQNKKTEK